MADHQDMQQILARMDRMERSMRRQKRKHKRNRSRRGRSSSSSDRSSSRDRRREKRQRTRSRSQRSESSSEAAKSVTDDEQIVEKKSCENDLFGEKFYQDTIVWAPSVKSEITDRWEEILLKGIPDENLKNFLKNNPPPENCPRLVPPKMNEIIKGIMPETVISRDNKIMERQGKISASMAAAAKVLTGILEDDSIQNGRAYIESLLDTTKLLADIHHDESMIRRNLILTNVDRAIQNTLKSTSIDEFLFGKDLEVVVKSAKAMQTTGKDLKKVPAKPRNGKLSPRSPRDT